MRNTSNIEHESHIADVCPICNDMGFLRFDVPVGHAKFGQVTICECQSHEIKKKRQKKLRSISNLAALSHYTFDSFILCKQNDASQINENLQRVHNIALNFAENPNGWLVFVGNYGCGKTHLAVAIANDRIQHNQPALFVVVPDLLDHLRATYHPYSTVTYDERFEEIRSSPLLILDDLGTQASTPWAQEKLFQIFNDRYNRRLPTVVTTNVALEELDARLRSRLVDRNLSVIVHIEAPDFRDMEKYLPKLSSLSYHADKTFTTFDLHRSFGTSHAKKLADNLEEAYKLSENYAQNPSDWLIFTGKHGCGKTHLAAAIALHQSNLGEKVLFIVMADLLDHLRATYHPNSSIPYDKRFEQIRNAPLLVLDDLGTYSATPWAQEKMYQLLNHRYNARLPTVITLADTTSLDPVIKARFFDDERCEVFFIKAGQYKKRKSLSSLKKKRKS
ncbi:MAG: hypothetical protein B6242_08935 [Anaerolineaceae bacterium 4572_78]|nr:MAG: hypothetical protein B6242_08935 [Anaerolineaceae bacterium 4572_78]